MKILKPKWYNGFDPTGWWMAEKFDGVRAEWDGHGSFMSKADKMYYVPQSMKSGMPNFPLSGEFWLGRKMFQKTVSIVRNQRMDYREWGQLKFMVFELPTVDDYDFETRQNMLYDRKHAFPDFCHIIPWRECKDKEHFDWYYNSVLAQEGEGVVLSRPESTYHFGRSSNQFKKTPTYTAEAIVMGHTEGTGRHEGRCGALKVEHYKHLADGTCEILKFKVGTGLSDVERDDPPKIGEVITYSYKGLTNAGKPRHPAFIAVRDYE